MTKFRVLVIVLLGMLVLGWGSAQAAPGDATADAVLGQVNFTNSLPNGGGSVSAAGLEWPYGMAVDPTSGRLYMADYKNNRVLSWPNAETFSSGAAADKVIGQPNFTSNAPNQGGAPAANTLYGPVGVAVDPNTGRLYVAEYLNHRVVSYEPPITTGMAADRVYGQPTFNTNTPNNGGISASSLQYPWGVTVGSDGRLFVSDYGNNRVLAYFISSTNLDAQYVFGQPAMNSNTANNGGLDAGSLSSPAGIVVPVTSNTLFVADSGNHRVLGYDLSDVGNYNAFMVLGQDGSFTTNLPNKGGLGPKSMWLPTDLVFDTGSNFYVADRNNNRVLRFAVTNSIDDTADGVFGQPNFTSNTVNNGGVSANSLSAPYGLTVTPGQNLLVADRSNHRVLRYDLPQPYPLPSLVNIAPTKVAIGSPSFQLLVSGSHFTPLSSVTWNGQTRPTTYLHAGMLLAAIPASDVASNFSANVRVVNPAPGGGISVGQLTVTGYATAAQDTIADRELGQPDFAGNVANNWQVGGLGPRSLDGPEGVTVDRVTGRLYISDVGNHRILSWPSASSFTNADPADLVIGQPDMYNDDFVNWSSVNASNLHVPFGLAVDGDSNLYVADNLNNRVLVFLNPVTTDKVADFVFGQPDFTSTLENNGGVSANSLDSPFDVAVDSSGSLYIADTGNNRVLVYLSALTSDRTADLVIGHPNFTTSLGSGFPTATGLASPRGLAVDAGGRLYVADYGFNRILVFDTPLTNGAAADFVLGQPDFVTGTENNGGLGPNGMRGPNKVTVDVTGNVYVSDYLNHRVLAYLRPLALNDRTADFVFGQPDFTSNQSNQGGTPSANTLYHPTALVVGQDGDLFISDSYNSRLLVYDTPLLADFRVFVPLTLK